MKLIAHRGNLNGPNQDLENRPEYIEEALALGFDSEIDLWFVNDRLKYFLGHDFPQYEIAFEWLERYSKNLWIHCKNYEAIFELSKNKNLNYFWHQDDDYTITSSGYIWAYPGMEVNSKSILVLPEKNHDLKTFNSLEFKTYGICSDYVKSLKNYK